jgi:hypothetical protein
VIKAIYEILARDEARHGGAYLRYMKKAMGKFGDASTRGKSANVHRGKAICHFHQ